MTTVYDETQIFGPSGQPKNDIYTPTVDQDYRLGTRYVKGDGRVFHYAKAGAVALVAGDLLQSQATGAVATEQQDMTIATASAVGDNFGYATIKTDTTTTEDYFKDGWYAVTDGTAAQGCGQIYQIKSHPAAAAASCKFTFYDTVKVAISTSAKATVRRNQYEGCIQAPVTTPTGMVVGVPLTAVTASYYFWCQTWGPCNVLIKTALTPGQSVIVDLGAAGSAGISGGSEAEAVIGIAMQTVDTTDNGLVYLQIAP